MTKNQVGNFNRMVRIAGVACGYCAGTIRASRRVYCSSICKLLAHRQVSTCTQCGLWFIGKNWHYRSGRCYVCRQSLISKNCETCGKKFRIIGPAKMYRRHCSRACYRINFSAEQGGKFSYKKTCPICEKEFPIRRASRMGQVYCSVNCRGKAQQLRIVTQGPKLPRRNAICERCGKEFPVAASQKGRFCSRLCYWKWPKSSRQFKAETFLREVSDAIQSAELRRFGQQVNS